MRRRLSRLSQRKCNPSRGLCLAQVDHCDRLAILTSMLLTISQPKIPRDDVCIQQIGRGACKLLFPDNLFNLRADWQKILTATVFVPCPAADIEKDTQPGNCHCAHLGARDMSS